MSNKREFKDSNSVFVEDLIKIYKRGKIEVVALRGLTAEFRPGEISIIMGPSGCGKTTLLNLIGGLDKPSSGKIYVKGENICDKSESELQVYRRDTVGFVFQFMNLIPELTAEENISLPMLFKGVPASERKKRTDELLKLVGLEDRRHHKPDELSGGEQQRVAIAMALVNRPHILLCDEPTGELDSEAKKTVLATFRRIVTEYPDTVVIIVTHDPFLKTVADRLFYIKDGVISHILTREEFAGVKDRGDYINLSVSEGVGISPDKVIKELREIEYIIRKKIEMFERAAG